MEEALLKDLDLVDACHVMHSYSSCIRGGSSLRRTMGPHYSSASKRGQAPRAALAIRDAGTNPGLIILNFKSAKKDKPQAVHKYQTYGQTHTKARGTCQSSHIPEHVPMQPCRITSQLCEILPDGKLSANRPTVKTTSQCQTS